MMHRSLPLSRVLIIGTSGVGFEVAKRLVAKGVPVHLISRDPSKLESQSSSLGGCGTTAADVSDTPAFEAALKSAIDAGPPLTGLVYAVGSIPLKPFKATTAADYELAWRLNFLGAATALRLASPSLSSGPSPGSAVLFSSVAARCGFPKHCAIASAKGAVESFALSAAAELAPKVRVNCVSPSLTDTPLASKLLGGSEAVKKAVGEGHPMNRIGTAGDVAAMTTFLLDDEVSSWITGQVFHVDGGKSTLRPKN